MIEQALAYLDRFDLSQGFLDHLNRRPDQENNSNLTLDGKLDGHGGFKINVRINSNYSELTRESCQINSSPFVPICGSIHQIIPSPCTSRNPKIMDSKLGGLDPLNRSTGHVQSMKGSKQPKMPGTRGHISATDWSHITTLWGPWPLNHRSCYESTQTL